MRVTKYVIMSVTFVLAMLMLALLRFPGKRCLCLDGSSPNHLQLQEPYQHHLCVQLQWAAARLRLRVHLYNCMISYVSPNMYILVAMHDIHMDAEPPPSPPSPPHYVVS